MPYSRPGFVPPLYRGESMTSVCRPDERSTINQVNHLSANGNAQVQNEDDQGVINDIKSNNHSSCNARHTPLSFGDYGKGAASSNDAQTTATIGSGWDDDDDAIKIKDTSADSGWMELISGDKVDQYLKSIPAGPSSFEVTHVAEASPSTSSRVLKGGSEHQSSSPWLLGRPSIPPIPAATDATGKSRASPRGQTPHPNALRSVDLDQYLIDNGLERVTCDKCGQRLPEVHSNPGDSAGIVLRKINDTQQSVMQTSMDDTTAQHPLSIQSRSSDRLSDENVTSELQANSRRSTIDSTYSLAPALPDGYVPSNVAYGWGPGVTETTPSTPAFRARAMTGQSQVPSVASSRRTTVSVLSSVGEKPIPSNFRYGWDVTPDTSLQLDEAPEVGAVGEAAGSGGSNVTVKYPSERALARLAVIEATAPKLTVKDIEEHAIPALQANRTAMKSSGWMVSKSSTTTQTSNDGIASPHHGTIPDDATLVSFSQTLSRAASDATLVPTDVSINVKNVKHVGWEYNEEEEEAKHISERNPTWNGWVMADRQARVEQRALPVIHSGTDEVRTGNLAHSRPEREVSSAVGDGHMGRTNDNGNTNRSGNWQNGVSWETYKPADLNTSSFHIEAYPHKGSYADQGFNGQPVSHHVNQPATNHMKAIPSYTTGWKPLSAAPAARSPALHTAACADSNEKKAASPYIHPSRLANMKPVAHQREWGH